MSFRHKLLPNDLIDSALEQAVADGTVTANKVQAELLRRDAFLISEVAKESATLLSYAYKRERVAGFVRDAIDPYTVAAFERTSKPDPFDLIKDIIEPSVDSLLKPLRYLFSLPESWTGARRLAGKVAIPAITFAAWIATLSLVDHLYARSIRTLATIFILIYGLGLTVRVVQAFRYRKKTEAYNRTYQEMLSKLLDESYQDRVSEIIWQDPDYLAAQEAVETERTRVVGVVAERHIADAVRRAALYMDSQDKQRRPASTISNHEVVVQEAQARSSRQRANPSEFAALQDGRRKDRNDARVKAGQNSTVVFISYVSEDSRRVDRLHKELSSAGIDVWRDRERLKPGQRWKDVLHETISSGGYFLACFSSASEAKERSYMREELALAVEEIRKRPRDRTWFIPVLLDSTQSPKYPIGPGETLRDIQHVSLHKNWRPGLASLIEAVLGREP